MSFKSEAATVRAGLKSGSYKKADPDPYGFMGFAEQVTFGIRAEAEQRRKEDLIEKQQKAAERKALAAKQAAKEAADKKIKGYITRAMADVTSGYSNAPSNPAGLAGMNDQIFTAVQDMGITTYKGVQDLLASPNFRKTVDGFYAPVQTNTASTDVPVVDVPEVDTSSNTVPIYHNGYKITPKANGRFVVDGGEYAGVLAKESFTIDSLKDVLSRNPEGGLSAPENKTETSVSTNLETAANSLNTQTDNLFGTSTEFDMSTLEAGTWEAEIDRVLKQGRDFPNKYPNAEETAQQIRDVASSKGWVTFGGLSTADIRSKTSAELQAEINQMEAGIGGQNVSDEDITKLKEFVVAKQAIEQEGAFWNKPEEIFTKLASEDERQVLVARLELWKLTSDKPEAVKNIENAITIFDAVQNNRPLDDAILEKMVGADVGVIEGLKAVYGDRAKPEQMVTIEKLISLAKEKDSKDRKPKDLAFTSWAARTGLAESLASTDEAVRKEAEKDLAAWEKLWSGRTSIAKNSVEWWQDAKNLSKMSLTEVDLLLDSGTITEENNKEAYAALLRLKPTLEAQATESGSSELAGIETLDELNRYLIANEAKFEGNDALKAAYTKMHVELQKQEAAANEGKTIDPKERARRKWMEDNQIENPSAMTFEQIGAMEKAVSELISPADDAEIITNSEMFRVGDSYVKRDTDGKLRDIYTNEVVEPTSEAKPIPESIRREISKDYTRIRDDLLTPMSAVQSKSLGTIRSAKRLSEIATKNPEVLTTVGTAASFLGRLSINLDTLTNYANQGLSPEQVVDRVMNEQLQGTASAQALFDAEILKYAYLYASVNLEQSGRGLSDTDFKQALRQVKASDGKLETFEGLLRQLTNETIGKVRGSIENIFGSEETGKGMNAEVASLERTSGQPIGNYPRNMDEFIRFNRLDAEMAWLNGSPSTGPIVEQGGNGSGNNNEGQNDFYGDGATLEGIPENAKIKSSQSAKTLIERTDYEDIILINTLMKQDPKLSRAQATLILNEARGQ
jgi:hypothetical protein